MKNFREKKKIILAVLIFLFIVSFSLFLTRVDLKSFGSKFKKIGVFFRGEISVFAQQVSPFFFPSYPQRLSYLISEISQAGKELNFLNEDLEGSTNECDCKYAQSQCVNGPMGCSAGLVNVFGDPCQNRAGIEEKQSEIKAGTEYLSYLTSLLGKEMEAGLLQRELESLDPEVAENLQNKLNILLNDTREVINVAEDNRSQPDICNALRCSPVCWAGNLTEISGCLAAGTGEQKSISVRFKLEAGLSDLPLGQVKIRSVDLGLPREISLPSLGQLASFEIAGQEFAFSTTGQSREIGARKTITLHIPQPPTLPRPPSFKLGIPQLPDYSSSYQCDFATSEQPSDFSSEDLDWYWQTFEYLSSICQEMPGMMDASGTPKEKYEGCFDPTRVVSTILSECSYCGPGGEEGGPVTPPQPIQVFQKSETFGTTQLCIVSGEEEIPSICPTIGMPETDESRRQAAVIQCKNLFSQEGEPAPFECDSNPMVTLLEKCDTLKNQGRAEAPELCKIIPLFTGELEGAGSGEYSGISKDCPTQTIGNYPSSVLGYPTSKPIIPKICLPQIKLPDIKLPTINLKPFLYIKLPSLITEDLNLPCIELCNLNDCQNLFPNLEFQPPILSIPTIQIPPIQLGEVLGVPLPDIEISPIQFPHFAFPILSANFLQQNLRDFTVPKMEMSKITLPKPWFKFSFGGIDLGAIFDYIVTFILNALGIPDFSLCISFKIVSIPLSFVFPDYIFSWPAFPEIPEIPFCKDVRGFCQNVKSAMSNVINKAGVLENFLNGVVQREIQSKLNQATPLIVQEIEKNINQRMEDVKKDVRKQAEEQISQGKTEIVIKIKPIKIPGTTLDEKVGLPTRLTIPWPEELKTIVLGEPIVYNLPTIRLSKLKYSKDIVIQAPGFQGRSLSFDLNVLGNKAECLGKIPIALNPCPKNQIQDNVGKINNLIEEIKGTSQELIDILE